MRRVDLVLCCHAVAVFSLLQGAVFGQTVAASSPGYTFHALTDLIEVPVLALKPPFQPVRSLNAQNFEIRLDGGKRFYPRSVHVEGNDPISLVFVVEDDTRDLGRLSVALRGIDRWPKDVFSNDDRIKVIHPGCGSLLVQTVPHAAAALAHEELANVFSRERISGKAIKRQPCRVPTMAKLLQAAIGQVEQPGSWKVLVVLMNGEHLYDPASFAGLQAFAAVKGVTLFAVKYVNDGRFPPAYSPTEGVNLLVSSTGGITLESSFTDLSEVIATVVGDVRARYILSFPRPGNGTAGAHRMEVRSNVKGVRLITSAASAPLLDVSLCNADSSKSNCTVNRPQYGPDHP